MLMIPDRSESSPPMAANRRGAVIRSVAVRRAMVKKSSRGSSEDGRR